MSNRNKLIIESWQVAVTLRGIQACKLCLYDGGSP